MTAKYGEILRLASKGSHSVLTDKLAKSPLRRKGVAGRFGFGSWQKKKADARRHPPISAEAALSDKAAAGIAGYSRTLIHI